MNRLARALEARVYVAVCRGLWDYTAKEVFDYVEGLQEGKENKVMVLLCLPSWHYQACALCSISFVIEVSVYKLSIHAQKHEGVESRKIMHDFCMR